MSEKPLLSPPPGFGGGDENAETFWDVKANNSRVAKAWRRLMERAPENSRRCYEHLRKHPTQPVPRRIFPLRGKAHQGAWEYEVTGGDRVYYIPNEASRTVVVYYAGKYPDSAPIPPKEGPDFQG